jgi:GDPmannose 4,6-dehydratase
MSKKILITGVLGQDGANMCEYLLEDADNKVFGMTRRVSNPNFINCQNFLDNPNFQLVYGDLVDEYSIAKLVQDIQPDYFINFAANSFVGCSWDMPMQVFDANAIGVMRCLEAIRSYQPKCKFYSAGSSEEFGDVDYSPQDMKHPVKPRSPYGASKASARHLVKVYRESYDMYAVHGILFNHEGTKRGEEFVTRKITKGVARIYKELKSVDSWRYRHGQAATFAAIELGNLDSKRDWSDSEDFVEGVWLMLNQESPKDYILSSGETHSIREFVSKSFKHAGISGNWADVEGDPLKTKFLLNSSEYVPLVVINEKFYRPAEVDLLLGDSTPIREELGWKPKVSFDGLVKKMVNFDIEIEKRKSD